MKSHVIYGWPFDWEEELPVRLDWPPDWLLPSIIRHTEGP
jgi:hypothetical protein